METSLRPQTSFFADRLLIRGIHLSLTDALRTSIESKVERLFRHESHIIRIRVDLEHDHTRGIGREFIAKGQIEIRGPDLLASVASDDAYKSVDLLVDKLDTLLRRRAGTVRARRRHPSDGFSSMTPGWAG